MKRIYGSLGLLLLSVLLFQCQREVSYIGGPDTPAEIVMPEPITAALQGNVFDENGAPAAGVTVQVGSKTTTTNTNGYFRINDAPLDKKSALVTATKAGYFKGYRTFAATSGANQVVIKLAKKIVAGTINASAGGEVTLSNGCKIALPALAVVNAVTAAAYTGTVNIYATYIDPTASDIAQTIPGSFMATNKDGGRVTLTSYGMVAVELESSAGEKLQIKPGTSATLTTAIPASIQASAPASIALWSIDETTGLWKEEGTATKTGNVYVGTVKHFSFWNCDFGLPAITLSVTLKTATGAPIVHATVRIKRTGANSNSESYGCTDSLGQVSGLVPRNEALVLEVLNRCYNPFYSQNVGPFLESTNLNVITVANTGTALATVKGKLVNCTGATVTNGYAIIKIGYNTHFANVDASGNFETNFTSCSTDTAAYSIIGVDNTTQQQSISAATGAVTVPITNAGTITACGTSSAQYINYTLDGVTTVLPRDSTITPLSAYAMTQAGVTISYIMCIDSLSNSASNNFSINFFGAATAGTYAIDSLSVRSYRTGNVLTRPFNVVITNFPQAVGEFYEGSFAGQFKDFLNVNHTISASFKVRRLF